MADSTTYAGEYGVKTTLEGYVIESLTVTETPLRETVPDQYNRVVREIRYDTRKELRLTVRGQAKPSDAAITVDGQTYIVDSVEAAGTYNGLHRYNVTGHATSQCTAETALVTAS